jgi:hypothetical protein
MRPGWSGTALLGLAIVATPVPAQDAAPREPDAGRSDDTPEIERALERVALALERLVRGQEIELILRRIELKERRLAPLESRARNAEADAENQRTQLRQMDAVVDELKQRLAGEVRDGADRPDSPTREELARLQRFRESTVESLEDAERRMRDYDDQAATAQREIRALEDVLVQMLE